jgi:hypothetical protein
MWYSNSYYHDWLEQCWSVCSSCGLAVFGEALNCPSCESDTVPLELITSELTEKVWITLNKGLKELKDWVFLEEATIVLTDKTFSFTLQVNWERLKIEGKYKVSTVPPHNTKSVFLKDIRGLRCVNNRKIDVWVYKELIVDKIVWYWEYNGPRLQSEEAA